MGVSGRSVQSESLDLWVLSCVDSYVCPILHSASGITNQKWREVVAQGSPVLA